MITLNDIRSYSQLERTKNGIELIITELEKKLENSHTASVQTEYKSQIAEYEKELAAIIRKMTRIDVVIIQQCDVDRLILEHYKRGEKLEMIAEKVGCDRRTVSRHLEQVADKIRKL
jgi:hypothetical protein